MTNLLRQYIYIFIYNFSIIHEYHISHLKMSQKINLPLEENIVQQDHLPYFEAFLNLHEFVQVLYFHLVVVVEMIIQHNGMPGKEEKEKANLQ